MSELHAEQRKVDMDEKLTPHLPSSRFVPVPKPPDFDRFGPNSQFEVSTAPVRLNEPDFGMVGWRMMEASSRLAEFRSLLPEVMKDWTGYMEVRAPWADHQQLEMRLRDWQWNHLPTSRRLTFIASEIVHHVRVCLDYLAYNAVWVAKGEPREHTKFPLVLEEEKWNQERRNGVRGIKQHHLEWIKEVQPFNGVKWTKHLVDLSNQDKHRTAVELAPVYTARFDPTKLYSDPGGDPSYRGFATESATVKMRIVPAMEPKRDGPPGLHVNEILGGMIDGGVGIVNKFITEVGYKPLELVRPEDESSPDTPE